MRSETLVCRLPCRPDTAFTRLDDGQGQHVPAGGWSGYAAPSRWPCRGARWRYAPTSPNSMAGWPHSKSLTWPGPSPPRGTAATPGHY